ncbi:MAG: DUF1501 domain-containing protein [Dokdonella sp.]
MSIDRRSRRDFIRQLACLAASGGAAALIPQLRMMGTALAASAPSSLSGYRALVCVYLAGGNDAWNMLVPYDQSRYDIYAASRSGTYDATTNPGGLGLPRPSTAAQIAAQVVTDSATSQQYFLNSKMPEIKNQYAAGRVAFVANTGPLTKPITKADYATVSNRPPQLYSHSDQENLWHVGTAANNRFGWGGSSMAKLRAQFPPANNAILSPCISISGSNKFEVGTQLFPYQMSSSSSGTTNPLSQLSGVCNPTNCTGTSGQRDVALNHLLQDTYQDMFTNEYATTFERGRDLFALLYDGLSHADGQITTPFVTTNNSLAGQLLSVARMIRLSRKNNYAARQIYYVRLGGFDMHSDLMGTGANAHGALLAKVSTALQSFSDAMAEIGATNDVTAFTMSEFGRTLSSNGNGSDHGWGSIQMAMGGAVQGGRLYADGGGPITGFPNQSLNNSGNFSRGQFIPGIAVEQYAATLARWLGVTSSTDLDAIFPNLAGFNASFRNLGFLG